MPLRATKPHLMSILPGPICSYRSALRMRARGCQKLFTTFPSRATATGSPRKVLSVPKPMSGAVSHSVAPSASEVRDSRLSLLANNLARDGKATLFQAESHAGYMYAGWMGGLICLGGALLLLNEDVYDAKKELPWFVPGVFRVSAVLLIGFAGWAVARSARRISSIQILPGNDKARLVLNVRRNIPLPFIKPQRMTVLASDVTLQRKVVIPMGKQFQAAPSLRNPDQSFIRRVARSIGAALSRFFSGARQFICSDGIIWVSIKGRGGSWKLDGYGRFPENGDRLMKMVQMED
ncbi:hypothetical protein GJ744_006041 [Endocarpon pusillum]|uniref:Uncharacterized protein n=1 Tax=Endocarpon pusillum TaxID=364733 RepID=A0A8H7AKA2_9EURO|nr:hypothetical protein GJ744_006041 [Endocarpon pusillum]